AAQKVGKEIHELAENFNKTKEEAEDLRNDKSAANAGGISGKLFAGIEELSAQVNQVNAGMELQRDRVTETATAMEEMNSTVLEVAQNAGLAANSASQSKDNAVHGAKGVSEAIQSFEQIKDTILNLKETMGTLG
ncbi:bacteriohemerythrin, partial [Aduncisulcus paluster]